MKGSKLKQTVIKQSYLLPLLLMVVLLAGCKTSKVVKTTPVEPAYLSSKLQLTVPNKNGSMTVSGSMKMKSGERIQLSVLMPVFRFSSSCCRLRSYCRFCWALSVAV